MKYSDFYINSFEFNLISFKSLFHYRNTSSSNQFKGLFQIVISALFITQATAMTYQQMRFIFIIYGIFFEIIVSTSRWLIKFNYEMKGYRDLDETIVSDVYLESLHMLFNDDAIEWVEFNLDVIRILINSSFT